MGEYEGNSQNIL